ncbi:MAG TPA: nucleotidyltransferase domain-containing protein [Actinomycetota bacterium]|nr:nucleotidyltransferase domain-containing protein [Actinomycetota bacterium]
MRFEAAFGGLIPGASGAVLAVLLRTGVPLTGRQVHGLVRDQCSLWSVQQALASLADLGVVESRAVGRAMVHTINEDHYAIQPLRVLLDPIAALREAVRAVVGSSVDGVVLFGSVARGEATAESDVDLAVVAPSDWEGRTELEDAVRTRLGNDCDVLVFTPEEFGRLAGSGEEPVVAQIVADGVVLLGSLPQATVGVA